MSSLVSLIGGRWLILVLGRDGVVTGVLIISFTYFRDPLLATSSSSPR